MLKVARGNTTSIHILLKDNNITLYMMAYTYFMFLFINEIRNFNHRRSITRLRISAHRLKIETGGYIKLDRSERLCDKCTAGTVEDEQHFLIECSKFNEYRNNLFQTVNCNNKNFSN